MSVVLHFLNVGPGDCTIVHFPSRTRRDGKTKDERVMMVDIYHNNDHEEYEDVVAYYKKNFKNTDGTIKPIFRFICTHPHQDHICGLAQLLQSSGITISNFWDVDHEWEPESFDGHETHEDDWKAYKKVRTSKSSPKALQYTRESKPSEYWSDDEDRIEILAPSKDLIRKAHYNDDGSKKASIDIDAISYALLIHINSRKVLLAGDGKETPCWEDIYSNCKEKIKNLAILKAGHHGHESAFHEAAVKLMKPEIIVFSNSEGEDYNHGADNEYLKASSNSTILKTCDHGTVVIECPFDSDDPMKVI